MHSYHEGLPGFDAGQILHDGCLECEQRAQRPDHGMAELDTFRFQQAWERATELHKRGLRTVSAAEHPMLETLWIIQVQLERRGAPIGTFPALEVF